MELQIIFSLITLFIFSFFLLTKFVESLNAHSTANRNPKLPPGPRKLPIIGNILSLANTSELPHRTFSKMAKKYGPLMHLKLGEISAIIVSSPRLAKEALKTHDLTFADRPDLLATKIVGYDYSDIAFAPYGAYWRQMRKICTLELLSAKKVQEFRSIREYEISHLINSILSSLSGSSSVNLSEKIYMLSNTVTCRAVFGELCKDQGTMIKVIQDLVYLGGGFQVADLFPSWKFLAVLSGIKPKLMNLRQKAGEVIDDSIKEHMEKKHAGPSKDEDLIDVLLRIRDSGGLEFPITSDNIKAVVMQIFGAGTDTSSTVIEWAMSEMMRNPRVMHKAKEELRQALKGKKIMSEIDIQGLCYLKLIIKETLRLHPPFPLLLPRECREPCQIDGYDVPIKTKLIINAWVLGRDPEFWHDPESFEPERFDRSCIDFRGANFEYIPFGAGKRICPGITFGLANVELTLAQLLYHFDWKLPGNIKPEELDMTEAFGAASKRKNNLYLIATPYTPLDSST